MKTAPRISVIIPAFNAAPVIAETLHSALNQTFGDFEIIVADNGSTDGTAEIVAGFSRRDPRVRLLHEPQPGSSCARNAAARNATGEWLAFLDADDVWSPEKLGRQLELAAAHPQANFLFTDFHFWDGRRELNRVSVAGPLMREKNPLKKLICSNLYLTSTVMLRREMFNAVGGFDESLLCSQDWDLWLRLAQHGLRTCGLAEPLVRYRRWDQNITARRARTILADSRVVAKHLAANQRPELAPVYRRSLASRRAELELVRAALVLETNPARVKHFVWRAWRRERRLKWLRWHLRLIRPNWLGGETSRQYVFQKIRRNWAEKT